MQEFVVVDHPTIMPMACVVTGDTSGQMIDTGRELVGIGRVYIAKRAVIGCARAFGLVKGGQRYEQILAAMESLEERESEIKALERRVAEQDALIRQQSKQLQEHDDYRLWAEGHIEQLNGAIEAGAAAFRAVAGAA